MHPIPVRNAISVTFSDQKNSMIGHTFIALACALGSVVYAADCTLDQPRKEGDPSGTQIAKAVGAQTELDGVCANRWRINDEKRLENSYTHWRTYWKRAERRRKLTRSRDDIQDLEVRQHTGSTLLPGCFQEHYRAMHIQRQLLGRNLEPQWRDVLNLEQCLPR